MPSTFGLCALKSGLAVLSVANGAEGRDQKAKADFKTQAPPAAADPGADLSYRSHDCRNVGGLPHFQGGGVAPRVAQEVGGVFAYMSYVSNFFSSLA